jgi:hypothetical protein
MLKMIVLYKYLMKRSKENRREQKRTEENRREQIRTDKMKDER